MSYSRTEPSNVSSTTHLAPTTTLCNCFELPRRLRGRSHTWNAVIVMHVRDRQFTEAWFHFGDQYALDEYLTSLAVG